MSGAYTAFVTDATLWPKQQDENRQPAAYTVPGIGYGPCPVLEVASPTGTASSVPHTVTPLYYYYITVLPKTQALCVGCQHISLCHLRELLLVPRWAQAGEERRGRRSTW